MQNDVEELADTHVVSSPMVKTLEQLQRQTTRDVLMSRVVSDQPYLLFTDAPSGQQTLLPILCSNDAIEDRFGVGNRLYFNFLFFCLVSCLVLTVPALASWIFFMVNSPPVSFGWDDFFVSQYARTDVRVWFICCVVIFILYLWLPITYFAWERCIFRFRSRAKLHVDPIFVHLGDDAVVNNLDVSRRGRYLRRLVVVLITLACAVVATVVMFGIVQAENALIRQTLKNHTDFSRSTVGVIVSLISGFVLVLLSAVWFPICLALTRLETHRSWVFFRLSQATKLLGFRLYILFILFIFAAKLQVVQVASSNCILLDHATKLLAILAADIVGVNGISIVWALCAVRLRTFFWKYRCCRSRRWRVEEPETLRAEFDISLELLQIIYRQFVIYIAITISPWIPVVGGMGLVVEFFVSRLLMLRLTQTPKYIDVSLAAWLGSWLIIISLAALLFYPLGVWLVFVPRYLPFSPLYYNCSVFGAIKLV